MGLTERTKRAAESFVQSQFPSKLRYFDAVWSACLGSIGIQRIEDAGPVTRERIHDELTSPRVSDRLRSASDRKLALAILILVSSVDALRELKKVRAFDEKSLTSVVQDAIARTNLSANFSRRLIQVLPHLVASIFDIELRSHPELPQVPVQSDQYYVEWRLPDGAGPKSGYLSERQIETEILAHRRGFRLMVDERTSAIVVRMRTGKGRKSRDEVEVDINVFDRRHKILLGLVLEALRLGSALEYSRIIRKTYGNSVSPTPEVTANVRRTFSFLNTRLHIILKGVVVPDRMGRYKVDGSFPYCWIRSNKDNSILRDDHWHLEENS